MQTYFFVADVNGRISVQIDALSDREALALFQNWPPSFYIDRAIDDAGEAGLEGMTPYQPGAIRGLPEGWQVYSRD